MSYVTGSSYGGGDDSLLGKAENVIPMLKAGRGIVNRPGFEWGLNANAALAVGAAVVGTLLLLAMAAGVSSWFGANWNSGMTTQWLGARHPNEIRRSDGYSYPNSANKRDTFFSGNAVGPEFVEQPNYVLGQEDTQRTAMSKYNRLKSSGVAVGAWPAYWAAYQAENSDDLSASMYDFGDDANMSGMATVGQKLRSGAALRGGM